MLHLDVLSTLLCSAGQSEAVPKGGTKNHSCSTCGLLEGWDTLFRWKATVQLYNNTFTSC